MQQEFYGRWTAAITNADKKPLQAVELIRGIVKDLPDIAKNILKHLLMIFNRMCNKSHRASSKTTATKLGQLWGPILLR